MPTARIPPLLVALEGKKGSTRDSSTQTAGPTLYLRGGEDTLGQKRRVLVAAAASADVQASPPSASAIHPGSANYSPDFPVNPALYQCLHSRSTAKWQACPGGGGGHGWRRYSRSRRADHHRRPHRPGPQQHGHRECTRQDLRGPVGTSDDGENGTWPQAKVPWPAMEAEESACCGRPRTLLPSTAGRKISSRR